MVRISIETVRRANAIGIARGYLKKIGQQTSLYATEKDVKPEIKKIIADKDKLKSAFKKAWDSVVNNKF